MAVFMNVRRRKVYKQGREYDDEIYRKLFRFNRENVQWLANHFLEDHEEPVETRGGAVVDTSGALNQMGYEIELVRINEYNRLSIRMFDREVFRCDLRNLMFNMSMEDDPVCQRAVKAVQEAKSRMSIEVNLPGFDPVTNSNKDLALNVSISHIPDACSSKTDNILEKESEILQHSATRHLIPSHENLIKSSSKTDEKVGKVTIMEDKNTTFVSEPLERHFDLDDDKGILF